MLAEVAAHRTVFRRRHVLAEARRYLMRTLAGATAPPGAADAIADQVLADADCLEVTPPDIHPAHPDLTRPDGTSVYQPIGARTFTTATLLAAENRLLAAARTRVIPPVGRGAFARAAALHDGPLDTGQRELASSFALSERLLLAGLGPAGSGKTTSMRLLAPPARSTPPAAAWFRSPRPRAPRKSSAPTCSARRTPCTPGSTNATWPTKALALVPADRLGAALITVAVLHAAVTACAARRLRRHRRVLDHPQPAQSPAFEPELVRSPK